ncbi:MAG: DUF6116 family protein [Gammaproteobacteria bacterium]
MNANNGGLIAQLLRRLAQLRFRNLFLIFAGLLTADLVIPDFIPLIDEILLGILTIMFWAWRKPERVTNVIENDHKRDA